ncbi:hypothetical protein H4R19_003729, partial [Coemansia spiralis]
MKGVDGESPLRGRDTREAWLAWADSAVGVDDSVKQALASGVLRPFLQAVRRPVERREVPARLVRSFSVQLVHGCSGGECTVRFCRGNARYAGRLEAMGRAQIDALAVELSRRAVEWPDDRTLQPHDLAQLPDMAPAPLQAADEGGFAQAYARHMQRLLGCKQATTARPARGDCVTETIAVRPEALDAQKLGGSPDRARSPAMKTIMAALQPPLPQQQQQRKPVTPVVEQARGLLAAETNISNGSSDGGGGGPMLGVARLDAQTAPLVAKLGGSLLSGTVELVFRSPAALGQCFMAGSGSDAPAAFGLDMAAAAAFMEAAFGVRAWHMPGSALAGVACRALLRCLAAIEGQLARAVLLPAAADTAARALAIASLFVALAAGRPGVALQRRLGPLIVRLVYRDGLLRAPAQAALAGLDWHAAFARDSAMRRQWVQWWAAAPAAAVRQWVRVLKSEARHACAGLYNGLTSPLIMRNRLYADPVRWAGALELLRLMWEANQLAADDSSDREALGADEFHSDALLDSFALGDETRRWMEALRRRAAMVTVGGHTWTCGGLDVFSPFLYPFLFSAASVHDVHTAEAHERMRLRYLGAHTRQAELLQYQRLLNIDGHAERAVRPRVAPGWPLLSSNAGAVAGASSPYLVLSVRRRQLVQDAMDMLSAGLVHVRFPLKVRFVASGEDGVDMGGVQKELYAVLLPLLLAPERGLFVFADDDGGGGAAGDVLWPNAASPHDLRDFELLGALLGIAFVNGIALAGAPLAPLLVHQLAYGGGDLGARAAGWPLDRLLRTVGATFPALAAGLQQLLDWDEHDGGAVEDVFCRSFDVTVPDPLHIWQPGSSLRGPVTTDRASGTATFALAARAHDDDKDGDEPVTGANRDRYVRRYLEFVAFEHARPQIDALRHGFARAADGLAYRMLGAAELERWLCGSAVALD